MTDFNIEVIQQPSYSLEITTATSGIEINSVEVVTSGATVLEITNRDKILTSDFPDNFPISQTTGLLPISRIENFGSGVSGLLPITNILGTSGVLVTSSGTVFTISATGSFGLTSNEVRSLLNSGVSIYITGNSSGNFSSLNVGGIPVSVSGHSHSVSNISNFGSGVSGLLPVISITGGYGIGVTNISGAHTIYSTLETVNEANALVTTVFNESQVAIPKFTAVYISGGHGDLPTVSYAIANTEAKSSKTYAITQESIPAMSSGHVVMYGNIIGLNTDQFNPSAPQGDVNGQVLYLSPTVSGGLTITKPYAPNHLVALGTIIRTHQNQGVFNVRVQNGFELEELHNVATTGAVSGQFLKYNGGLWRNTGIFSSDIGDFASAVSGISPNISISGTSGISVDKNGNNYTIYTTGTFGLSSSQVQSLLNSGVNIYVTGGTGNFSSLSVGGTGVSLSGHTHISSNITNFNSAVSGLLPSVSGSGYAAVGFSNNIYTVSVTGLQPSGNYSVSGHAHTTSNITDFNSATSGLLAPYALLSSGNFTNLYVAGTPVSVSGHTHTSSQITNFNSSVSGLLPSVSGSGYASVGFLNNVYTVSVSGLQPTGNYSISGHTHIASDITDFNSSVSGLLSVTNIVGVSGISVTSSGTTFTIASTGSVADSSVSVTNPGSGRILSSNGTSSGVIAQPSLTFVNNNLFINGVCINNANNLYMWSNFR